jgi:hypothetical protein
MKQSLTIGAIALLASLVVLPQEPAYSGQTEWACGGAGTGWDGGSGDTWGQGWGWGWGQGPDGGVGGQDGYDCTCPGGQTWGDCGWDWSSYAGSDTGSGCGCGDLAKDWQSWPDCGAWQWDWPPCDGEHQCPCVPGPAAVVLSGVGVACVGFLRRRRSI